MEISKRSMDIVILDDDEAFVRRLAGAIGSRSQSTFNVRAFTQPDKAVEVLQKSPPDALIVGEGDCAREVKDAFDGRTVLLTDTQEEMGVCRYSPVSVILDAIGEADMKKSGIRVAGDASVTGIFSFCETSIKSAYALALAMTYAKRQRTLYLNLDEFSGLSQILKSPDGLTVSDAIYAFRQKNYCSEHVLKTIQSMEGLDYIAPTMCVEDIASIRSNDVNSFVNAIAGSRGYERIVIDVGSTISEPWELYKFCDEVDMPCTLSVENRIDDLKKYMFQTGRTAFFDLFKRIDIPKNLIPITDLEAWQKGEGEWKSFVAEVR